MATYTASITFTCPDDGYDYLLSMTTRTPTATAASHITDYSVVLYFAEDTEFSNPIEPLYEYSTTTISQLKTGISLESHVCDSSNAGIPFTILLTYTANGNYLAYIDDLALTKVS